jgi:hypothetical protein
MFVRRLIVDDQMQVQIGGGLTIDLVEKANEILMPMTAHALTDYLAFHDVEGGDHAPPRSVGRYDG